MEMRVALFIIISSELLEKLILPLPEILGSAGLKDRVVRVIFKGPLFRKRKTVL